MKLARIPPGVVRAALPLATILATIVAALVIGIEIALLIVAGGALLGVVALLWASVQSLTGEAPLTLEEALGLGAPSAEEEQKRAVLRALKDLEFERSVGKISDDDYAELSARYREEAKRLMQSLDQSSEPERARVDKLVQERLATEKRPKPREAAPATGGAESSPEAAGEPQGDVPAGEASPESAPPAESARAAREAGGESS
jgi:hypothetical protein